MDGPPLVLTGGSKVQGGTFGNRAVHSAFEIGLPNRINLTQQHGQEQDYKRRIHYDMKGCFRKGKHAHLAQYETL